MSDLRRPGEFWPAFEAAGRNVCALADEQGVARRTVQDWKGHHEHGDVWDGMRWAIGPNKTSLCEEVASEVLPEEQRKAEFQEFLEWLDQRTLRVQEPVRAQATGTEYLKALIGGDLHYPLHDEWVWNTFLALADFVKPAVIGLNGDTLDLAQISKFPQNPSYYRALQDDLDGARNDVFGPVNAVAPGAERWLNLGNHEWGRWQRYLWTKAPAIASLRCLQWEALLGMAEIGWHFNPHEWWAGDSCIVYHGERHTNQLGGGSAMSARKEMIDMGALSGLTNHTHHGGMFLRKNRSGYYVWYENGMLGSPEKMQEAGVTGKDQPTKPEDWHPGCSIISYRPGHSAFHIEWIPILRDERRTFAIYQDQEIAA